MLKHTEFVIYELSFGLYLAKFECDTQYMGVPVFPNRKFRHSYCVSNTDAGIDGPADLEESESEYGGGRTLQRYGCTGLLGTTTASI